MPVDTQHPEYTKYIKTWQRTRDAVCGTVAIKEKRKLYLPSPSESGAEDSARYDNYICRALFTNFTARTKNALVGAAFRKPPEIELPAGLEYLELDATGDGLGLEQLSKDSLGNILETSREGFLVDYPPMGEGLSAEDMATLKPQATINPYPAEAVINWKTETRSGRTMLSLVTLQENYSIGEDSFSHETEVQYRVLALDTDGHYFQQVFRDGDPYEAPIYPRDSSKQFWNEIPFIFCGAQNNDATVDDAPLADIAEINIAHYRNSADYEEGAFVHGQPTVHVDTGDMSNDDWSALNPNGVLVGARSAIITAGGGKASLMQAEANGAAHEAMILKEDQIVKIGARVITDRSGQETAEAARIRFSSENSVLGDVVVNLSTALEKCIRWCGQFMGVDSDITYQINTSFFDKSLDPQTIMALITAYDRGALGMTDLRRSLRAADMTERNDEEIDQEVDLADPLEGMAIE